MASSPVLPTKNACVRFSNATPSGFPAGSGVSVNTRSCAPLSSWPLRAEATVAPTARASTARTAISVRFMGGQNLLLEVRLHIETRLRADCHGFARDRVEGAHGA